MPAFTRIPYQDQIAPATPADVVPPTPQAQTPNVGGTPSLSSNVLQARTIANLLGAIAEGTAAKENKHDILLFAAADLVGLVPELAEALRELMDFDSEAYDRKSSRAIGLLVAKKKASALLSKLKGSN